MGYCVEASDTKSQFNPFYIPAVTQQNLEKLKGCEYFLKAQYFYKQLYGVHTVS